MERKMVVRGDPYKDTILRKDLYVIFTKPVAPREEIWKIIPEHLKTHLELEKKAILLPATPMDPFDKTQTRIEIIIVRVNSF